MNYLGLILCQVSLLFASPLHHIFFYLLTSQASIFRLLCYLWCNHPFSSFSDLDLQICLPVSRMWFCHLNVLLKVMYCYKNRSRSFIFCFSVLSTEGEKELDYMIFAGVRTAFNSNQQRLNWSLTNFKVVRHFNQPVITTHRSLSTPRLAPN